MFVINVGHKKVGQPIEEGKREDRLGHMQF